MKIIVTPIENRSIMFTVGKGMSLVLEFKKRQKWECIPNPYISDRFMLKREGLTLNLSKADMESYFKVV